MRPLTRSGVNKRGSARDFRSRASRTKVGNISPGPMRGGIRL